MILDELPHWRFMDNKDWYEFDHNLHRYVVKENAPQEAKESYKEFLEYYYKDDGAELYELFHK